MYNQCLVEAARRVQSIKDEYPYCEGLRCEGSGGPIEAPFGEFDSGLGSLKVIFGPDAVTGSGAWKLPAFNTPWYSSGYTIPFMMPGTYKIGYKHVDGYISPDREGTVDVLGVVKPNETTLININYLSASRTPAPILSAIYTGSMIGGSSIYSGSYEYTKIYIGTSSLCNGGTTTHYYKLNNSGSWISLGSTNTLLFNNTASVLVSVMITNTLFGNSPSDTRSLFVGFRHPVGQLETLVNPPEYRQYSYCNIYGTIGGKTINMVNVPTGIKTTLYTGSYQVMFGSTNASYAPSMSVFKVNIAANTVTPITAAYQAIS